MTEKTIEKKLCDRVKKMGGLAVKLWAVSLIGLPDRLVLMPGGKAYFAEIKAPGETPKPHQTVMHKRLTKLGFTVAVIDGDSSLRFFLERIA